MSVNPYFNHFRSKSEQSLYEDLIIENIKNSGVDIFYIPREYLEIDPILGEPLKSSFNSNYRLEAYFTDPDNFSGGGDLLSKFGVYTDNTYRLEISRKRFLDLQVPERERPHEGDLIYLGIPEENDGYGTFPNAIFEITFCERSPRFFQHGKYFTYQLKCQLFTYNNEKFNTGNAAIDVINEEANPMQIEFGVNNSVKEKENTMLDSFEKNPFGDL